MLQGEFIYEGWVTDSDLKVFTVYNKESVLSEIVSAQRTWIIKITPSLDACTICVHTEPQFLMKSRSDETYWSYFLIFSITVKSSLTNLKGKVQYCKVISLQLIKINKINKIKVNKRKLLNISDLAKPVVSSWSCE